MEIVITGKLFNAIKPCNEHITCIRFHYYISESFDELSPTLFILFINDVAEEIKRSADLHGVTISFLLYAEDVFWAEVETFTKHHNSK